MQCGVEAEHGADVAAGAVGAQAGGIDIGGHGADRMALCLVAEGLAAAVALDDETEGLGRLLGR